MKTPSLLVALALSFLLLGGCGSDDLTAPADTSASDGDTGTLALGLTVGSDPLAADTAAMAIVASPPDSLDDGGPGDGDGPGDGTPVPELSALVLNFDVLRLYPAPGGFAGGGFGPDGGFDGFGFGHGEGHDDEGDWVELAFDTPVSVDLFDLEAGLVDLLATVEIPAGSYRGFGLHLVDAVATTVDGEEIPVVLPADHIEYLRVMSPFTIDDDGVTGLSLSFDLDAMLGACVARDGVLILRPVIGGLATGCDPSAWEGWHGEGGPHGDGSGDGGPGGHH